MERISPIDRSRKHPKNAKGKWFLTMSCFSLFPINNLFIHLVNTIICCTYLSVDSQVLFVVVCGWGLSYFDVFPLKETARICNRQLKNHQAMRGGKGFLTHNQWKFLWESANTIHSRICLEYQMVKKQLKIFTLTDC